VAPTIISGMTHRTPILSLRLLAMVFAFGCAPEEDAGAPSPVAPTTPPTDAPDVGASIPTTPPTDAPTTPPTDAPTTPPTDAPTTPPTAPPTGGPVTSCADIGARECFWNDDCAPNEACLDQAGEADDIPCCVQAARGAGALGEPCDPLTGETQCASALCLEGPGGAFCTSACADDAACPATLPRCLPIAFSGSDASFCLPE